MLFLMATVKKKNCNRSLCNWIVYKNPYIYTLLRKTLRAVVLLLNFDLYCHKSCIVSWGVRASVGGMEGEKEGWWTNRGILFLGSSMDSLRHWERRREGDSMFPSSVRSVVRSRALRASVPGDGVMKGEVDGGTEQGDGRREGCSGRVRSFDQIPHTGRNGWMNLLHFWRNGTFSHLHKHMEQNFNTIGPIYRYTHNTHTHTKHTPQHSTHLAQCTCTRSH